MVAGGKLREHWEQEEHLWEDINDGRQMKEQKKIVWQDTEFMKITSDDHQLIQNNQFDTQKISELFLL